MPIRKIQSGRIIHATSTNWVGNDIGTIFYDETLGDLRITDGETPGGRLLYSNISNGGSANVTVSDTAPSNPALGNLWWDSTIGRMFIYYDDGVHSQWVDTNPTSAVSTATSSVTISNLPPLDPKFGNLWWDSTIGRMFIYYDDGANGQWVDTNPTAAVSTATSSVTVSDTAPLDPKFGNLWWDSTIGRMFIYYDDGTTSQWVDTSPTSAISTATRSQLGGVKIGDNIDISEDGTISVSSSTIVNLKALGSDLIPSENLTYSLGSTSSQWRSLYVGTSTIYIGGVPLSITSDKNLQIGGVTVTGPTVSTTTTAGMFWASNNW